MRPVERDDLSRLAKLALWYSPRDHLAARLRTLADLIEVKPR